MLQGKIAPYTQAIVLKKKFQLLKILIKLSKIFIQNLLLFVQNFILILFHFIKTYTQNFFLKFR